MAIKEGHEGEMRCPVA